MARFGFLKSFILVLAVSPVLFLFQNCSKIQSELSSVGGSVISNAENSQIYLSAITMTDVGGVSIKNKFGYSDGPVHGLGLDDSNHLTRY